VTFEIFVAYPPDRQTKVAQLSVRHDGMVDIPAEVDREGGELKITIFGRQGGVAWEYPLADWVAAVERAVEALQPK
jgi:hypothetical protein